MPFKSGSTEKHINKTEQNNKTVLLTWEDLFCVDYAFLFLIGIRPEITLLIKL